MKFQNGYNLIYEKKVGGENGLYATKTGIPGNDDAKIEFTESDKTAKLIYEKTVDGVANLYASESGIPSGSDSIVSVSINGEVVLGDDTVDEGEEEVITEPETPVVTEPEVNTDQEIIEPKTPAEEETPEEPIDPEATPAE